MDRVEKDGHIFVGLRGDDYRRRLKLYRLRKTSWDRRMQVWLGDRMFLWMGTSLLPAFRLLLLLLLLLVFNRVPLRIRIMRRRRG